MIRRLTWPVIIFIQLSILAAIIQQTEGKNVRIGPMGEKIIKPIPKSLGAAGLVSYDRKGGRFRSYSFLAHHDSISGSSDLFGESQFMVTLDKIVDLGLCVLVATIF